MQAPSASDMTEKKPKVTQAPVAQDVSPVVKPDLKPPVKPSTPTPPAVAVGDGRARSIPLPLPRANPPAPSAPASTIPLQLGAVPDTRSTSPTPSPIKLDTGLGLPRDSSATPAPASPPQSIALNLESSASARTTAGEVGAVRLESGDVVTPSVPTEGESAPEGSTTRRLFNPGMTPPPPASVQAQPLAPPSGSVAATAPSVVVPAPNIPASPSPRTTSSPLPTAGLARAAEQTNTAVAVSQLTAQQVVIAERRAESQVLGRFMRRMLGLETNDAPPADEPGR
jgi:hypothetical protein